MNQQFDSSKEGRSRGLLSGVAYFAGVGLLLLGLSFILPASEDSPDTAEPAAAPAQLEDSATTEPVEIEVSEVVAGEEPVADAAEVIMPSVVHIQTSGGIGAGVVYSSDGLILTAAHVVDDDETVLIRFANGEQVEGAVLGARPGVDVAVIQVESSDLAAAAFNTDKPRVGQAAIAVGSPWGLESTVTAGIISAVDQTNCDFGGCFSMVQTDAAINPGNSGGPLVDRTGAVVGINVSIRTGSGASDGVGFAVPSGIAVAHAESIISGEPLQVAFLGVSGGFVVEGQAGALVTEVFEGTSAAAAGIAVDDVIISLGGVEILGINDLAAQVRSYRTGESVEVVILRDDQRLVFDITLGERPPDEAP